MSSQGLIELSTISHGYTAYSEREQQTVLRACLERCSLRGVARIFTIAQQTVAQWLKAHVQNLPDVKETFLPVDPDDVLELDEIWSFVRKKDDPRWLWTAMCRRTRQIVAFAIGDRSKATCLRLWNSIPEEYKHCHTFSDFWTAYPVGFGQFAKSAARIQHHKTRMNRE